MKITLIQSKPEFLAVDKNLEQAVALLENLAADVAVFPEGEYLIRMATDREQVATLKIDPSAALDKYVTQRNHVMADRRRQFYSL